MIRLVSLCLLVLICFSHYVLPYSPFRFRFRAFPESSGSSRLMSPANRFRFHKRSYVELQCRGMYDPSIFAQLDGICDDCYNLYREPEVHGMCRKDCFSTHTFTQCLQSLLLERESDFYMELVQTIGKRKKK